MEKIDKGKILTVEIDDKIPGATYFSNVQTIDVRGGEVLWRQVGNKKENSYVIAYGYVVSKPFTKNNSEGKEVRCINVIPIAEKEYGIITAAIKLRGIGPVNFW